jgi:hypothetical protein
MEYAEAATVQYGLPLGSSIAEKTVPVLERWACACACARSEIRIDTTIAGAQNMSVAEPPIIVPFTVLVCGLSAGTTSSNNVKMSLNGSFT